MTYDLFSEAKCFLLLLFLVNMDVNFDKCLKLVIQSKLEKEGKYVFYAHM